ncbi:SusE domain-containing protein [Tenacibaculum jejuense]|uniref:Probable lipoprotein, SusE family n=1 Tax=Tenacibaculum jejuense TaxID=584609 RepID=A0A238U9F0_9FLAO|nr:SusE domain-containing protein [Tenacibaculum jejuense]SNR15833.1 Probable lipoprotein precursor, SusE family [Tenacibaculum jejuense]
MKNKFIYKLSSLVLLIFIGIGCEDNSETFTVSDGTAPDLGAIGISEIEIDQVNVNNPAVTFNWSSADYGQQTAVVYDVEFSTDQAFTNPIIGASVTGENAVTFSMGELNTAVGNAGLNPFEWADIHVRIVSSLGKQRTSQANSNAVSLRVFPFYNYIFDDYFLVGDGTAPGWENDNENPALFRDASDENLFKYTGFFSDGQFKVLETKGAWQPQWGTNDGTTIEVNPGGGDDPERFPTAGAANITPGFYTFTINFATQDFTFEPFDASGATSPSTLVLQGTGVNAPITLTPLAFDGHIWRASTVRLKPGEVQFLANGTDTWGSDTAFSGIATNGGANIPVIVEDNYDIWFNDLTGEYILIPLNL